MDKRTKLKVTAITIIALIVTYIYINRAQLISNFETVQMEKKWEKEEPIGQIINGKKNGEWKTYFKNGKLAKLETYKNDTLHGKSISYRPSGEFYIRCNYNEGTLADTFQIYYSNGNLNASEFYGENGKLQGEFKIYHKNGQLKQVGHMVDGLLDGEIKMFYESGKIEELNYYKNRQKIGTWLWLSESGDTTKIEYY